MCLPDAVVGKSWRQELNAALKGIQAGHPGGGPVMSKTIYFVRHAESMSNVAREGMSRSKIRGAVRLCASGFDSPLSALGRDQLLEVRAETRRLEPELQAVLHSPLKRARQTALTLFGDEDGRGGYRPTEGKVWLPLQGLKEMKLSEHAQANFARSKSMITARALAFIEFLAMLPFTKLAVVGHSRFFSMTLRLMGVEVRFKNASVWKVTTRAPLKGGRLQCLPPELVAQPTSAAPPPPIESPGHEPSQDRITTSTCADAGTDCSQERH